MAEDAKPKDWNEAKSRIRTAHPEYVESLVIAAAHSLYPELIPGLKPVIEAKKPEEATAPA